MRMVLINLIANPRVARDGADGSVIRQGPRGGLERQGAMRGLSAEGAMPKAARNAAAKCVVLR